MNFYIPLICVSIYCQLGTQTESINVTVCYQLELSNNFQDCLKYGMFRKLMAFVDDECFHVINLVNIVYPVWIPHACFFRNDQIVSDYQNFNEQGILCKCDCNKIHHNFQINKAFFLGCFGFKWHALHFHPPHECHDLDMNLDDDLYNDNDDEKMSQTSDICAINDIGVNECLQPPRKRRKVCVN